jgi:hypothetical protein
METLVGLYPNINNVPNTNIIFWATAGDTHTELDIAHADAAAYPRLRGRLLSKPRQLAVTPRMLCLSLSHTEREEEGRRLGHTDGMYVPGMHFRWREAPVYKRLYAARLNIAII